MQIAKSFTAIAGKSDERSGSKAKNFLKRKNKTHRSPTVDSTTKSRSSLQAC